jgi:hypothetical protein
MAMNSWRFDELVAELNWLAKDPIRLSQRHACIERIQRALQSPDWRAIANLNTDDLTQNLFAAALLAVVRHDLLSTGGFGDFGSSSSPTVG